MTLDEQDLDRIAERVVARLHAELDQLDELSIGRQVRLVDAALVARALGVERKWVYAHARRLGAVRLGGPHGRLRFDLDTVRDRLAEIGAPGSSHCPLNAPRRGPWPGRRHHLQSTRTPQRAAGRRRHAPGPTPGGLGPDV